MNASVKVDGCLETKHLCIKLASLCTCVTMWFMWTSNFRRLSIITPMSICFACKSNCFVQLHSKLWCRSRRHNILHFVSAVLFLWHWRPISDSVCESQVQFIAGAKLGNGDRMQDFRTVRKHRYVWLRHLLLLRPGRWAKYYDQLI